MTTFKHYLQAKEFSKVTIERYTHEALCFLAYLDGQGVEAEQVQPSDVMGYLQKLKRKGAGNSTRASRLNGIRHFFDYQIKQEKRINNPTKHIKIRGVKQQTLYHLFTALELETFLEKYKMPSEQDTIKNNWWYGKYCNSRKRDKIVLSLFIHQGLSSYDINRLELGGVDLHKGTIKLEVGRKSAERELEIKSHQIIPLMEYTTTIRTALMKDKELESNLLFPCSTQRQNNINLFKRLTKELKEIHPKFIALHQIRNSVITIGSNNTILEKYSTWQDINTFIQQKAIKLIY